MYWICHQNIKLLIMHALKYKIVGVVFVPCQSYYRLMCFLAALVALRYIQGTKTTGAILYLRATEFRLAHLNCLYHGWGFYIFRIFRIL